jgi:hypothetical protein
VMLAVMLALDLCSMFAFELTVILALILGWRSHKNYKLLVRRFWCADSGAQIPVRM